MGYEWIGVHDMEIGGKQPKPDAFKDDHDLRDFAAIMGEKVQRPSAAKPSTTKPGGLFYILKCLWNFKVTFPYAGESADRYSPETYKRLAASSDAYARRDSEREGLAVAAVIVLCGLSELVSHHEAQQKYKQ